MFTHNTKHPTCPVTGFLSRPGPTPPNSALRWSHCHLADMGACGGTSLADVLRRFQRTFEGTFRSGDDSAAATRTYQSSRTRWLRSSCYEKPGKETKPTATAIRTSLWPWWPSCLQGSCMLLQENGRSCLQHITELNWLCSEYTDIFITFVIYYYYYYYYYYPCYHLFARCLTFRHRASCI